MNTVDVIEKEIQIIENQLKEKKRQLRKEMRRYVSRVKWVIFSSEEERSQFYDTQLTWGDYSKISRSINRNAERIRQVFIRKPNKLHPEIYEAINKFKKEKTFLNKF